MRYNYVVPPFSLPTRTATEPDRRILAVLLMVPWIVSMSAFWIFSRSLARASLFAVSNFVGPTAESLLHGAGLSVCTEAMGTLGNPICFHAARMPLPSLVLALGVRLLGTQFLPVAFLKMSLLLLPLEAAFFLVWCHLPRSRSRQALIAFLLLVPFAMTPLLADVVNLQVEEGYTYSFLALAVAILFFATGQPRPIRKDALLAMLFAISVDAVYLAKSSMAPAVLVLTVAFVMRERRTVVRLMVVLLVAAAPVGWAIHQHHASGRYALGTSIDGINLHKGNNQAFLDRYPPQPGDSLDRYDPELNAGQHFQNEWSFNDFHQQAATDYIRSHPYRTFQGDVHKLEVIFIITRKLGSSASRGLMLKVETAGLILFRLLLWTALGCAFVGVVASRRSGSHHRRAWVSSGVIFLCLVGACALPYVLGFAYIRHVSTLIYPSVLMCCTVLAGDSESPVLNLPHRADA